MFEIEKNDRVLEKKMDCFARGNNNEWLQSNISVFDYGVKYGKIMKS